MFKVSIFIFLFTAFQLNAEEYSFGSNIGANLKAYRIGSPQGMPMVIFPGFGLMPESYETLLNDDLKKKFDIYVIAYRDTDNKFISSPVNNQWAKSIWNIFNFDIDYIVSHVALKRQQKVKLVGFSMGSLLVYSYLSGVFIRKDGQGIIVNWNIFV